jgi:Xaa-Pro aminopeptidase
MACGISYFSHYVVNDKFLKDGDLVLVDAGVEYEGYASDITRSKIYLCFLTI